jgi:hypothetical protein
MRKAIKVTQEELKAILMNIKTYQFVNIDQTTPLLSKMVKNDRQTKLPNPLVNGFLNSVLNVSALATTQEGKSGYQARAEKNGKGADFQPFKEAWFKYVAKVVVTDRKTESKFYFAYERHSKVRKFFTKFILNGAIYTNPIGDVWNKVSPNKRGCDIRTVNLDHINRMTIDGTKYIVVR